jgi:hypothetical protein
MALHLSQCTIDSTIVTIESPIHVRIDVMLLVVRQEIRIIDERLCAFQVCPEGLHLLVASEHSHIPTKRLQPHPILFGVLEGICMKFATMGTVIEELGST